MKQVLAIRLVSILLISSAIGQGSSATDDASKPKQETKYLAFQIFTYGPNPRNSTMGEGKNPQPARLPEK